MGYPDPYFCLCAFLVRLKRGQVMDCLSEFGFYSVFLGDGRTGEGLGLWGMWEFPKIGVPYFGVLIISILLFRVLY